MIGVFSYTVILTYMSVISAGFGMVFAINGHHDLAILMLIICGILDLFDGPVARTKKNRTQDEKSFGIQIDSFCDLISFGIFPAVIAFTLNPGFPALTWETPFLFLVPLAGLIRLAYFNVQEEKRQAETNEKRHDYVGLPITASSVVMPLVYLLYGVIPGNIYYIVFFAVLMIVAVLFVLKIKVFKPGLKGAIFFGLILVVVLLRIIFKIY